LRRFTAYLFVLGALVAVATSAEARRLEVTSSHERVAVKCQGSHIDFYHLPQEKILTFNARGPGNVGLRLCEIVAEGQAVLPIDLTVVRDGQEQATVRVKVPEARLESIGGREGEKHTGMLLVKIEIPAGQHRYMVLASGPPVGVLVNVFHGVKDKAQAIVVTPGKVGEATTSKVKKDKGDGVKKTVEHEPGIELVAKEPDILACVPAARGVIQVRREGRVIHHHPVTLGPWTRTSSSLSGMFVVGTISLLVSGAVISDRSREEPVQLEAGRLYDQAERTYRASAIMGGLAGVALLVTLVAYLVEDPGGEGATDNASRQNNLAIGFRF